MKKYLLLTFLVAGIMCPIAIDASCSTTNCQTSGDCCGCPCGGKTFFSARPLFQSYRPELWSGFRNDRILASSNHMGGALNFAIFGSTSTDGDNLAAYFLPNCKQCLTVREHPQPFDNTDVEAQNFNIITVDGAPSSSETGFESIVSFCAQETVIGFGMHYKQGFWFNHHRTKWWYVDIATSVQQVQNKITINENIINSSGGADTAQLPQAVESMTVAFNQSAWKYGKIESGCNLKETGLADIELKLGYQWMWHEYCHYAGYFGVLIPTGNKPKGIHVFEPIVGHNHHLGIFSGTEGGFEFWTSRCEQWHANFEFAAHGQYMFQNTQTRSFDLKNKPWSRYINVYANQAQAQEAASLVTTNALQAEYLSTPGINEFTKCVNVQPGFLFNATGSLIVSHDCGVEIEAGYNFYARHAECVTLKDCWQTGPALKDFTGAGETNPVRNITGNTLLEGITPIPVSSYAQSLITQNDLDLNSAAHPDIIINLLYGALTYNFDEKRKYPINLNAGGSYEFAQRDFAVMRRWVAWGKLGISF